MKYSMLCSFFLFVLSACSQSSQNNVPVQNTSFKKDTICWGKTTGKLPALLYGEGADRLGGATMGYIDTGVVCKIIGQVKKFYQVQLSQYHYAFMDTAMILRDTAISIKEPILSGSWKAWGTDSCYDIVTIHLNQKVPYTSNMEVNPSAIKIKLYGVQSNTNWITQLQSLKEIKNLYYHQIENDVLEVVIQLKHAQHWGYSINYEGTKLMVKVKRQPNLAGLSHLTFAIDAGHGGTNQGASGNVYGLVEKDYTLLFAKELEKQLKLAHAKVIMTRTKDTTFDNKDRILFLQQKNPDVLISLHLNSADDININGVSTYYKHIGFRPLTQFILKRITAIKMNEFGNVGSFNFALNAPTDFVNCLVEIAFLSNKVDEAKIKSPAFRTLIAKQIVLGVKDWIQYVTNEKN
jgi:N-acetylmuramoyl-L-alanine amidase